jgi:cytochrome P450
MLKKEMYPFFRASTKWIDPRRIPITKRQIKRQDLENKIKTTFILSNYYSFFFNRAKILEKNMLKHGRFFSTYHGKYLVTYVFSPKGTWDVLALKQKSFMKGPLWNGPRKLLGNGLLVSEDPDHFVYRRMTMSSFDHKKLKSMSYTMLDTTSKRVQEMSKIDKEIEVRDHINSLTLNIIMKCIFGVDVREDLDNVKKNVDIAQDAMDRTQDPSLSRFEKINLPYFKQFMNSTVYLYKFIEDIYEEKINSNLDADDLLSIYINSTDEDGNKMSKAQVLDEMLTIIMAGFESTSNALVWAIVYLNQNPEEYERLINEASNIFNSNHSDEDLIKEILAAPVCSNVIKETLRLAPPLWTLARMSKEDVEVDGRFIPKNSFVVVGPYATHRDPEIYENPEKFNPDRWNNGFEKTLPLGAYVPFSAGSRGCPGDQFAMIEMKIILLSMFSQFRIKTYGRFPRGFDRVTYRVEKPLRAKIIPS